MTEEPNVHAKHYIFPQPEMIISKYGCQEHIKLQLLSIGNLMSTQLSTKVCRSMH